MKPIEIVAFALLFIAWGLAYQYPGVGLILAAGGLWLYADAKTKRNNLDPGHPIDMVEWERYYVGGERHICPHCGQKTNHPKHLQVERCQHCSWFLGTHGGALLVAPPTARRGKVFRKPWEFDSTTIIKSKSSAIKYLEEKGPYISINLRSRNPIYIYPDKNNTYSVCVHRDEIKETFLSSSVAVEYAITLLQRREA